MGDLRLPQFSATEDYNAYKMSTMVDTLENTFSNISRVISATKKAIYQLHSNTTPVGNVGGGEDVLIIYTLPKDILAKNGYNIQIKAWGTFGATANNKTVKMYFGSTVLYDTGAHVANTGTWAIDATVTRTGAATQQGIATIVSSNTAIINSVTYTVPTETLSATIVIKCTGTGTADNDIVQNGFLIQVVPQE